MQVKEIQDKASWDQFVLAQAPNTFLQSWEWKEVQEQDGEQVSMIGFYEQEEFVAACLVILVHAKRGNYFLIPHGPILKDEANLKQVLVTLIDFLKAKSYKLQASPACIRIAPLVLNTSEMQAIFSDLGFRPSPMHVHAELTWVLDISKSEQEILSGMRKTTRHAIKKAEAAGVVVEIISDASGLERFWPLYEQTTSRHGFTAFKKELIASQAEEFGKTGNPPERRAGMFFAIASHNGADTAGAMFIQYGTTVFYYHGASIKTPIPSAQLLQWRAMQEAKKRGATRYNFWGIARDDEKNHPFAGITVFKKGFGGYAVDLLHAQDYVLSWKYWPMWLLEMIRKKRRGF